MVYECEVEEYRDDDDGGHWVTIHEHRQAPPFYLRDETGALVVEPDDATWSFERDYRETFRESEQPDHLREFVKQHAGDGGLLDVDLMGGERQRFTERYLEPGDDLYVLGGARPAWESSVSLPDKVELMLRRDDATDMFLLSDAPEDQVLSTKWWRGLVGLGSGVLLVPGCTAGLLELLGVV